MTLSPTFTSSGTRLPLSSMRPGPMLRTSPSWGFSFAVSGMTRPEAVVCSASRGLTTMRSSRGLMLTDTMSTSTFEVVEWVLHGSGDCFVCAVAGVARSAVAGTLGGRVPTANLALGPPECQAGPRPSSVARRRPARMAVVDLEAFRWLLTEPGQQLLTRATHLYVDHAGDPVRTATALRGGRDVAPEHAAAALTQVDLRARAVPKLGEDATRMYFTPEGLEQATRARVAAHRAARVAMVQPTSVLDLGCGIGGDLVALARAGLTVAGVDRDELRVEVARAKLDALSLGGAVQVAEAQDVDVTPFGVVFADPARRTARGRVFDVEGWSPSWDFVTGLLARPSVVKVAPGIPHEQLPHGVEAEWVSDEGDVKEAALWSPQLATVRRRATVIRGGGLASLTDEDDPGDAT